MQKKKQDGGMESKILVVDTGGINKDKERRRRDTKD